MDTLILRMSSLTGYFNFSEPSGMFHSETLHSVAFSWTMSNWKGNCPNNCLNHCRYLPKVDESPRGSSHSH